MLASDTASSGWVPPQFDVTQKPRLVHSQQLSSCRGDNQTADFLRIAKWSADGSTILSQCEASSFHRINLPKNIVAVGTAESQTSTVETTFPQAAPIVDFAWFPGASVSNPALYCFAASVRESPVKLLDASDGRLRASYRIVDHRERQIAPNSLAFNPMGTRLYCGFEDAIEVFDVLSPGEGTRLHTTPSKKSRDGLKGIISTLAFSNDVSSEVYAAGSLTPSSATNSNIALFTESTGDVPVMFVGSDTSAGFGVRHSCIQVMFNPIRPYLLYASFRRHDTIYCWDVRGDVGTPLRTYRSPVKKDGNPTNQKTRFDVDIYGRWLGVGDQDGNISLFDLGSAEADPIEITSEVSQRDLEPTLKYPAHADTIGSVGFHPSLPVLFSISGSRNFETPPASDESDSSDDTDEEEEVNLVQKEKRMKVRKDAYRPPSKDNLVKLWDFSRSDAAESELIQGST
ncbi:hypothetical protein K474DRAFT_1644216 [Panus rudis PR-1116 ss-1]|nr:hypothetical protein K474DRAFT_1644216 [Panus rudis PR-1116 ss-1]